MIRFLTFILFFLSSGFYEVFAQPYTTDSLQFKVYTIASYKDSFVKSIKLDRVFCDYCSDSQLKALGQLGLKSSNRFIKDPKNRLVNGQKRLAIYLRIAKKDFANIKEKDTIK